jgi:hypothetical protein
MSCLTTRFKVLALCAYEFVDQHIPTDGIRRRLCMRTVRILAILVESGLSAFERRYAVSAVRYQSFNG